MIQFKAWTPDQPALGLDGLTEALNVLPLDNGAYASLPSATLAATSLTSGALVGTLPSSATVTGAAIFDSNGNIFYAVAGGTIFERAESSVNWQTANTVTFGSEPAQFIQYGRDVIATAKDAFPLYETPAGNVSFALLATTGAIPRAGCVGQVGQFVMIGNLTDTANVASPASVRWSAIANPRNWPEPNSSTALASQAGSQDLGFNGGEVTAILGGDQFAVILQTSKVTRCTYIGGTSVFQFDEIDNKNGNVFPNSAIRVNDVCYFISYNGFMRTNGVVVEPIGAGVVDDYFWSQITTFAGTQHVRCAYDYVRNNIYWTWPMISASSENMLIYNTMTNRWTRSNLGLPSLVASSSSQRPPILATNAYRYPLYAFNLFNRLMRYNGPPSTAILTTGETEMNEGGRTFVSGVKPVVDVTANAVTVALGTRDDNQAAVTYTSETTANSRSRYCDFRSDARYHRARVTISGTFNAAQGLQFNAVPSGQT